VTVLSPNCIRCKHYHDDGEPVTCEAFPKRIPDEIWLYGNKHIEPFPGDNGIRFEPLTEPLPDRQS